MEIALSESFLLEKRFCRFHDRLQVPREDIEISRIQSVRFSDKGHRRFPGFFRQMSFQLLPETGRCAVPVFLGKFIKPPREKARRDAVPPCRVVRPVIGLKIAPQQLRAGRAAPHCIDAPVRLPVPDGPKWICLLRWQRFRCDVPPLPERQRRAESQVRRAERRGSASPVKTDHAPSVPECQRKSRMNLRLRQKPENSIPPLAFPAFGERIPNAVLPFCEGFPKRFRAIPEIIPKERAHQMVLAGPDKTDRILISGAGFQSLLKIPHRLSFPAEIVQRVSRAEIPAVIPFQLRFMRREQRQRLFKQRLILRLGQIVIGPRQLAFQLRRPLRFRDRLDHFHNFPVFILFRPYLALIERCHGAFLLCISARPASSAVPVSQDMYFLQYITGTIHDHSAPPRIT